MYSFLVIITEQFENVYRNSSHLFETDAIVQLNGSVLMDVWMLWNFLRVIEFGEWTLSIYKLGVWPVTRANRLVRKMTRFLSCRATSICISDETSTALLMYTDPLTGAIEPADAVRWKRFFHSPHSFSDSLTLRWSDYANDTVYGIMLELSRMRLHKNEYAVVTTKLFQSPEHWLYVVV